MREAALTSLTWTLLFFCFLGFTSGEEEVKAKPGDNVTLPCKAPNNNNNITVVEWSRPGRETKCAFLYREGRIDADSQNPIFKNRVDLQDKQMKDGNVSVILKNVTINDTGTYECRVIQTTTKRRKRDVDPIINIYLSVAPPPGPTGGAAAGLIVGLIVGLSVAAVLLVVVFSIYRKPKQNQDPCLHSLKLQPV